MQGFTLHFLIRCSTLGALSLAALLAVSGCRRGSESGSDLLQQGRAAARNGDYAQALALYDRVPVSDVEAFVEAASGAAGILTEQLPDLEAAERRLLRALEVAPESPIMLGWLARLYSQAGRRWESARFDLERVRQDDFDREHLIRLADLEVLTGDRSLLEGVLDAQPDDALALLGLGRLDQVLGLESQARERFERAVQASPDLVEAQARWGHVLADRADGGALADWNQELPEEAEDHPEPWVVRGRWAEMAGRPRAAIRGYLEALRRDPNHTQALARVAPLLEAHEQPALARAASARARRLLELRRLVQRLDRAENTRNAMLEIAALHQELGRPWEAWAWKKLAIIEGYGSMIERQEVQQEYLALARDLPQTDPAEVELAAVSLDPWPLPVWEELAVGRAPEERETDRVAITFRDDTEVAGIDFQYYGGHDEPPRFPRLYQVDGGGVGVLDFDRDGWPDIYLTQGCSWPYRSSVSTHVDRLYRNLGDGRFVDVTESAGLAENGFSQGVTVGDFNSDGWPDLVIANIGRNRLFQNRGDGTFEDVTDEAGWTEAVWSSSLAPVDVNADGLLDLYVVNYLGGEDVFTRTCPDALNRPRICPPMLFPAVGDQVLLNAGDGTYERWQPPEVGMLEGGRGLGVLVADLNIGAGPSIFVANDVLDNFFFEVEAVEPLVLRESAVLRGLAVDGRGNGQACMGVACGDVNNDGRLDFWVTNFYQEANTLYIQQADGSFTDETRAAGLHTPGYLMLGFGTEFLDADLDGWLDIVLTNGHLADESDLGVPYRMRSQFFRNLGEGRFEERQPESLGTYFQEERLGRSLATLDWNRDGREDFVISEIEGPASLVTNTTDDTGHYLALQFIGVQSPRDGFGTEVRVDVGGRVLTRQLVSGSGYQAANQQQLVIGLGDATSIERVTVRWPSGRQDSRTDIPVDGAWVIREGDDEWHALPR